MTDHDDRAARAIARKERRREATRQEILDAAAAVVAASGARAVTLDAVAQTLGLTKAALYFYFPSKDTLLAEVALAEFAASARYAGDASEAAPTGALAVEACLRATVGWFSPRLSAFRLAYQELQLFGPRELTPHEVALIRPLNDMLYGPAERKLLAEQAAGLIPARLVPRRLVFAAHLGAVGLLATKALVEQFSDPLRYSDDELLDELCASWRAVLTPATTGAHT